MATLPRGIGSDGDEKIRRWSGPVTITSTAVVLLHRKMTMERAEPISTTWRMFIFLANAMTTAIPNKTLLGSQGTATANRIVI